MPLNTKNITFYPLTKWISPCDNHALDHTPKAPHAIWTQTRSTLYIFNTLRVFITKEPIREQEIKSV